MSDPPDHLFFFPEMPFFLASGRGFVSRRGWFAVMLTFFHAWRLILTIAPLSSVKNFQRLASGKATILKVVLWESSLCFHHTPVFVFDLNPQVTRRKKSHFSLSFFFFVQQKQDLWYYFRSKPLSQRFVSGVVFFSFLQNMPSLWEAATEPG